MGIQEDNNDSSASIGKRGQSRRYHDKGFLDNEENRAKYLSEFHARPLEIDRRNNAVSKIKASSNSNHLFSSSLSESMTDSNNPFLEIGVNERISNTLTSIKTFGFTQ